MTYPTVPEASDIVSASDNSTTSVHRLSAIIPATVNAGDVLIALVTNGANVRPINAVADETGDSWTAIYTPTYDDDAISRNSGAIFAKVADGDEDGDWIDVTNDYGTSGYCHGTVIRIAGGLPNGLSSIEVNGTTPAIGTGFGIENASPIPAGPAVTPSWGAVDTMWMAVVIYGNDDETITTFPSGWDDYTYQSTAGYGTNLSAGNGFAILLENATSKTPGAYSFSAGVEARTITIALEGTSGPVSIFMTHYMES